MAPLAHRLLLLYVPLLGWVLLGLALGHLLPQRWCNRLGQFLFWVGVPVSVMGFLRQADLSGAVWLAPAVAWVAILLGGAIAWIYIYQQTHTLAPPIDPPSKLHQTETQGSFLLAAMVGNTGYLGYPVTLALVGAANFGWALFYDMLGTTLGAYGLGVVLASRFGRGTHRLHHPLMAFAINPTLWSFGAGLALRSQPLPWGVEVVLRQGAWGSVALSLVLIGMRLSQLRSWRNLKLASLTLSIKMVMIPLVLGLGLTALGLSGAPRLVLVLQMAMPPAFATLVIGEAYRLDRDLTVTALALGSAGLLLTLPLWLWLFPI
ncbi:AEC family transporter [Leptolyngbya sp. AN02str]|uniref:AEC family transporter n=1 Tax=Leptolyngbya sp. AN02str TaxID=3423363 RepID=UPI003D320DFD